MIIVNNVLGYFIIILLLKFLYRYFLYNTIDIFIVTFISYGFVKLADYLFENTSFTFYKHGDYGDDTSICDWFF